MTKTLITAATLALFAGAASASLFAGVPVDIDPSTLSDTQRVLIENVLSSGDSAAEIVRHVQSIVSNG